MKKQRSAMLSVCNPASPKHLSTIDIEVFTDTGQILMSQLKLVDAIDLATKIMIEVYKRNHS